MRTKPTKMDRSYLLLSFLQLHHIQNPTLNRPKSRVKVPSEFIFLSVLTHSEMRRGGRDSVLALGALRRGGRDVYYIKGRGSL